MGRVFVIEDDPSFLYLVDLVLTGEGHEVIAVSDGEQALKALETSEPELILLDMQMPVMSGKAFLQAYPRVTGHLIAVIAMSGSRALDATVTNAVVDTLLKPFDLDQLVDCVNKNMAAIGYGT
jgi:CheY-like chemotaxis protein